MRTHARALAGAVAIMVVLGLASCGGDDDSETSESSTTTTESEPSSTEEATTTTEPLPPEEQAWADLEAGSQAFSEVAAAPDPDAPELLRYFTGESLAGVQSLMRDLQAGSGGSINSVELHQYSVTVVGETATVDYCFVDSSQRLATSGNTTGAPEVTSMRSTAQMELIDDIWKLAQETLTPEECPAS